MVRTLSAPHALRNEMPAEKSLCGSAGSPETRVEERFAHGIKEGSGGAEDGRGTSRQSMRRFFLAYPKHEISQTPSGNFTLLELARAFVLPWSAYVRLLTVKNEHARHFYENEAMRGGWSVRQLDRQIASQFYERTSLSKDKTAMLMGSLASMREKMVNPDDAIKDPYVLEFLDLKDEYSESDLEEALIQ